MVNIINLGNHEENIISVDDYGREWVYTRILKPYDNKSTHYWNLFLKDTNNSEYRVIPGVLSGNYSIVKTEDIVNTIHKSLGGDMMGTPRVFTNYSDVSATFMLKNFQLNVDIEDDTSKILFALLTDINVDELKHKSAMTFNIINSMAGNRMVSLNYGFLTNFFPSNSAIKPLTINNTFILDEYTASLVHNDKLNITYHEVANIQSNVKNKIELYKNTPVSDTFIESLNTKGFPKKIMKTVFSKWEQLTDEFKNFYYLTFIISHSVTSLRKIEFEFKMRKFISYEINKIHKHQQKQVVNQ